MLARLMNIQKLSNTKILYLLCGRILGIHGLMETSTEVLRILYRPEGFQMVNS